MNNHRENESNAVTSLEKSENNELGSSGPTGRGETRWSQVALDGKQTPAPKQPNERDESSTSQAAQNPSMQAIGKIAHQDAETRMDTDRGPVLDAVYNGSVTDGHRVGDEEEVDGERDPRKSTSSRHP